MNQMEFQKKVIREEYVEDEKKETEKLRFGSSTKIITSKKPAVQIQK